MIDLFANLIGTTLSLEENETRNEQLQQPPDDGGIHASVQSGEEPTSQTTAINPEASLETTTPISPTQTETMEVHKHPHDVMHKKKWSEYILEFLMIFFAVFLGFITENIREKLVEKNREKEYIHSMIEDLQTDTSKISRAIPSNEGQVKGMDSLIVSWYNKPYNDASVREMYYLYRRYTGNISPMTFDLRTFDQLKNAGGMQLIRDKKASDSIIAYYGWVQVLNNHHMNFREFEKDALQTSYSIFDWSYFRDVNTSADAYKVLRDARKMVFLNANVQEQNRYVAQLQFSVAVLKNYVTWLVGQRGRCLRLMQVLHEQYH